MKINVMSADEVLDMICERKEEVHDLMKKYKNEGFDAEAKLCYHTYLWLGQIESDYWKLRQKEMDSEEFIAD